MNRVDLRSPLTICTRLYHLSSESVFTIRHLLTTLEATLSHERPLPTEKINWYTMPSIIPRTSALPLLVVRMTVGAASVTQVIQMRETFISSRHQLATSIA